MGSPPILAAAAAALWLLPRPAWTALSVMPHQSDSIVMQLRGAVTLDEKDLLGPLPPAACSSLDDGPYCARFGGGGAGGARAAAVAPPTPGVDGLAPSFLSSGDLHSGSSAQYVVDGVLSNWMKVQNKEAFDWSADTLRTFSNLVSRVISDSLGSAQDVTRQGSPASVQRSTPLARTGSQCFRLALDRLAPAQALVPADFSVGLPKAIAATWEGLWEAEAFGGPRARRRRPAVPPRGTGSASRSETLEAALGPPWATHAVLRTAVGYLRFAQSLVVRQLLVGVPSVSVADNPWGKGGLVCGRLKGKEQWCAALDQVAASARSAAAAAGTKDAEGGPRAHGGLAYADVGDSLHAVDEVAFIAVPAGGLALAMVEVVATLPSHPLHGLPAHRRVVLLRRPLRSQDAASVEPTLATVSRDAVLWDMNEVLRHHMTLRSPAAGSRRASSSRPGQSTQKELSFPDMLQALKAGRISPPAGVSFARLKREVAVLVAAAKDIQDDDLLLHNKIESLLQQRLRERGLDGLLALQAAWRRHVEMAGPAEGSGHTSAAATARASGGGAVAEAKAAGAAAEGAAEVAPGGEALGEAAGSSTDGGTDTDSYSAAADWENTPAQEGDQWADAAAEAMEHASVALERKAAEVREKKKHKAGAMEFQMDLERGTIELRFGQGTDANLQAIARQVSQALNANLAGMQAGAAEAAEGDVGGEEGEAVADDATSREEAAAGSGEGRLPENEEGREVEADAEAEEEEAKDMAVKMSRMVAAALKQASGSVGEDGEAQAEALSEEAVQEMLAPQLQTLTENLQEALRDQMAGASGGQQGGGEEGRPVKMQVHFVKLDDAGGAEAVGGSVAQMLQSLLQEQGGVGNGLGGDVGAEALQTMLQAAMQASADASADAAAAAEGGEANEDEDVVTL